MKPPLFSVIEWPESQFYMENPNQIHLIDSYHGYDNYGDSAYFVPIELQDKLFSVKNYDKADLFTPVGFPKSQLFMEDEYKLQIHLINDEHGLKKYGNSAYFVPFLLFEEVMENFDKELNDKK